jgi:mRNA-degrading endonuclease RelE of RelBE toxin-antitoxin system
VTSPNRPTIIIVIIAKPPPFALAYGDEVKEHLRWIDAKYYSLIQSEIEVQLAFSLQIETRNRKPLERPVLFGAEWELRIGPDNRFRVFYTVETGIRKVRVVAVGIKEGNRILIGGKEVER